MQTDEDIKSSEQTEPQPAPHLRFSKLKKTSFVLACMAGVLTAFIWLLLYKPAGFNPPKPIEDKEVSRYLTHVLGTELYNGAQLQEPFNLVVTQDGMNDIVARLKWPRIVDGTSFSLPEVLFRTNEIVLRGTVIIDRVEFFITIVGKPSVDEKRLLNLPITKVKIGAMNITPIAKIIAEKLYERELAAQKVDTNSRERKIAAALLQNRPFKPIFEVEGKKVRIRKVAVTDGKLIIHMVPADI